MNVELKEQVWAVAPNLPIDVFVKCDYPPSAAIRMLHDYPFMPYATHAEKLEFKRQRMREANARRRWRRQIDASEETRELVFLSCQNERLRRALTILNSPAPPKTALLIIAEALFVLTEGTEVQPHVSPELLANCERTGEYHCKFS